MIEYQDRYQLIGADGSFWAQLSGNLRRKATDDRLCRPAVGDWVAVRPGRKDDTATIAHLFERRSRFVRQAAGRRGEAQVVAANIDAVFVVTSLNRDFNVRRIERYLTTVGESGARPVIVLNKVDLCSDPGPFLDALAAVAPDVPVLLVSALERHGLAELRVHIKRGETVALVGSSGVGKSTLINWLVGRAIQAVGDVREDDGRGRHTTTHRELIVMPDGGILIDTPGMRELQLWSGGDGVKDTFAELEELATRCRFRDCSHQGEPGCAIVAAVESGQLDRGRLASYFKLKREHAFAERRQDEGAKRAERRRWKHIIKANRVRKRITGR
ncbi:MAG: ribosome small subunit-dependent GTPase A [Proteobacteria bacterium]|nr:ribosome small subunit-dependent GTPase A [Pseudomonadota bacterium]